MFILQMENSKFSELKTVHSHTSHMQYILEQGFKCTQHPFCFPFIQDQLKPVEAFST